MLARTKFAAAATGDAVLILAQADIPTLPSPDSTTSQVLDYGVTIAALGLLGYMIRLVLSGDLVSKSTIEAVVSQAVNEALRKRGQD